ncbi:MAG: metal-sulfur cluster assembly factor [Fidelibacterota bacterium]
MAVTEEQVIDILKECYDPEIPIDLWNLGLIYGIDIESASPGGDSTVKVVMSLTTPGCGMGSYMARDIQEKVESLPGVSAAQVEVTFEPAWTPEMMSDEAKQKLGFGNASLVEPQSPPQREDSGSWE